MLNQYELIDLETVLRSVLNDNLIGILTRLNSMDRLGEFLDMIGLGDLLPGKKVYESFKNGKILIIGYTSIKPKDIEGVVKAVGIDKRRIELCIDYKEAEKYDIKKKLQYNTDYSLVLAGPMGHSGKGKGEYSSKITAMEKEDGYPRVIRLGCNELKITKDGIKKSLKEALAKGWII